MGAFLDLDLIVISTREAKQSRFLVVTPAPSE